MVFTYTRVYYLLVICRMCTGLFQIIFAIFMPVYADVFGTETQKAQWLTYLLISNPLGVVMGYGICASFLDTVGWRWAFYIQSVLLVPSCMVLFCMPRKYVDYQQLAERLQKDEEKLKILEAQEERKNTSIDNLADTIGEAE